MSSTHDQGNTRHAGKRLVIKKLEKKTGKTNTDYSKSNQT